MPSPTPWSCASRLTSVGHESWHHAEEVLRIAVANPRTGVQERAQSDNKNGSVLDVAKREARILAHAADLVLTRFQGRFLLLSGAPQLRAEVMRELPQCPGAATRGRAILGRDPGHALEEKAALEMVWSQQARQLLAPIGPMAALLRW